MQVLLSFLRAFKCLVTFVLIQPKRNNKFRIQTSIFTSENQCVWVQMARRANWPPDVAVENLQSGRSQLEVFSQTLSARIPQPGILSQDFLGQEFSADNLQPLCLGSTLNSFFHGVGEAVTSTMNMRLQRHLALYPKLVSFICLLELRFGVGMQ